MKKLPYTGKRTSFLIPSRILDAMRLVELHTESKPSIQVRLALKEWLIKNHKELLSENGFEDVWNPSTFGVEHAR